LRGLIGWGQTMPIDLNNLRIDHTHCRAICDKIGERLREMMGRESAEMPPYLQRLVDRLDHVSSPGIVPLIEDQQSSRVSSALEPV